MKQSKSKLLKLIGSMGLTLVLINFLSAVVFAQTPGQLEKAAVSEDATEWKILVTSPEVKVLQESYSSPGFVLDQSQQPLKAAYNWLASQGLQQGRQIKNDKLLYVSLGSAVIFAKPSEAEYIDSRYLAFQRAELDAKAKIAINLGVDLSTERGSASLRTTPKERQALKDLYSSSKALQNSAEKAGISDRIISIFDKATRLAEAKLDSALEETETKPQKQAKAEAEAEAKAKEDNLKSININDTSIKTSAAAYAEIQGAQVIQTFEGSFHDSYMVVVITLWSQNIQKLVDSMIAGELPVNLENASAKEEILKQLPKDPDKLSCLTGVRVYINEHGERTLLAFGQAGVMDTGEKAMDFMDAEEAANQRALSALRTFMGESVLKTSTNEIYEALGRYVYKDGKNRREYNQVNELESKIQAQAANQHIAGVQYIYSDGIVDSLTNRSMVLVVCAWSPSSQEMAKDMRKEMQKDLMSPAASEVEYSVPQEPATAKKGLKSSGKGADSDAW